MRELPPNVIEADWSTHHSDIKAFRRKAYAPLVIPASLDYFTADSTDPHSVHLLQVGPEGIQASLRFTPEKQGKLPLHRNAPSFPVLPGDVELCRFVSLPGASGKSPPLRGLFVAIGFVGITRYPTQRLVTDLNLGGPSNLDVSSYRRFGFEATGFTFHDADFNCQATIMATSAQGFASIMQEHNLTA